MYSMSNLNKLLSETSYSLLVRLGTLLATTFSQYQPPSRVKRGPRRSGVGKFPIYNPRNFEVVVDLRG
jgi:hypothetical protein